MRYFIVTYISKPDGKYDEVIKVAEKLTTKMVRSANIILDFKNRTVEKARLETPIQRDFTLIRDYFDKIYTQIIGELEKNYPQPSVPPSN